MFSVLPFLLLNLSLILSIYPYISVPLLTIYLSLLFFPLPPFRSVVYNIGCQHQQFWCCCAVALPCTVHYSATGGGGGSEEGGWGMVVRVTGESCSHARSEEGEGRMVVRVTGHSCSHARSLLESTFYFNPRRHV